MISVIRLGCYRVIYKQELIKTNKLIFDKCCIEK